MHTLFLCRLESGVRYNNSMRLLKNPHFPFIALVGVYLISRFINLTVLPIFTDESIYIYWAKLIESTHSQWFVSLTDGKPPLLVWMTAFFLTILPDGWYLIAGRLPAVLAGAVSVVSIYYLAELLFSNKKIAIISAALYILFPFALLYDRMALFDPLLSSTLLASTYFAVKTAKKPTVFSAVMWGFTLGLAFLSKPTAITFFGLLPIVYLLFSFTRKKGEWKRVFALGILALGIAQIINNLQRISSVYFMAGIKNSQFQQPIEELLKDPFALMFSNLQGFFIWIEAYYTVPVLVLGIFGIGILLFKKTKVGLLLLMLWLAPIFALAIIGREIFPRYILFTVPYFLLALAYFLYTAYVHAKKMGWIVIVASILVLIPLLRMDYYLLTSPEKASLPQTDYNQLIATHPSGYGLDSVYGYINEDISQGKHVTLVTQGTFGLYPYAFMLEYWDNPNVTVLPRWPLDKIDDQIYQEANKNTVLIILKEHDSIPEQMPLKLIQKIEKPGGADPILVTELK